MDKPTPFQGVFITRSLFPYVGIPVAPRPVPPSSSNPAIYDTQTIHTVSMILARIWSGSRVTPIPYIVFLVYHMGTVYSVGGLGGPHPYDRPGRRDYL